MRKKKEVVRKRKAKEKAKEIEQRKEKRGP
jgi:hypothetical protein